MALLSEKPRHGYDIINEIGKNLGKKPSPGQIYPLMQKLRRKGYLRASSAGRKKIYSLTPRGILFSKSMIGHFSGLVRIAIRQNLKICAYCRCGVYSGAYAAGKKYFCCRSCADAQRRCNKTEKR